MDGELFLAARGWLFYEQSSGSDTGEGLELSDLHTVVIGTIADSPARFEALELFVAAKWPRSRTERGLYLPTSRQRSGEKASRCQNHHTCKRECEPSGRDRALI